MYYPPPPYYGEIMPRQDYKEEETYWTRRIENLKRAHESISKGMEHEYQRTLQQANELFETTEAQKVSVTLPPCQEEKTKVNTSIYWLCLLISLLNLLTLTTYLKLGKLLLNN